MESKWGGFDGCKTHLLHLLFHISRPILPIPFSLNPSTLIHFPSISFAPKLPFILLLPPAIEERAELQTEAAVGVSPQSIRCHQSYPTTASTTSKIHLFRSFRRVFSSSHRHLLMSSVSSSSPFALGRRVLSFARCRLEG